MTKLIIIRGNSGSGKSTIAKELRERAKQPNRIALIEQDYLRRIILKEKETEGTNNIDLIEQTVVFALKRNYDVILEGILYSERYKAMLSKLMNISSQTYIFYIDVSLEETLKRHSMKPNAHEFGEKDISSWHNKNDVLGFEGEKIITESSTLDNTITFIKQISKI